MESGNQSTPQTAKKRDAGSASRTKNCAECRRLKLRCDRQIPCSNCQKRGTASLCPDGQLLSKGQRVAFSNTEELHAKIDELSTRIVELEDALAKLQALHYDEPHPLLDTSKDVKEEPLVTSFGSLKLNEDGTKRFYGPTSTVEFIMGLKEEVDNPMEHSRGLLGFDSASSGPNITFPHPLRDVPDLHLISAYFPAPVDEGDINNANVRIEVLEAMPPRDTALRLINLYCDRAAWSLYPVPRSRLILDYFTPCYDQVPGNDPTMQHFALLYGVFGNAMLYDITNPSSDMMAAQYILYSKACLALDSPVSNTTLTAINTLLFQVSYYHGSNRANKAMNAEAILGITMQLAFSIGLHRDPSMWNLPAEEAATRRRTMWELVTSCLWASLISGRPPLISRLHFDVKLPIDDFEMTEADPNFTRGKHHFSQTCLWDLLDITLAPTNKSSYGSALKVDAKIRKWSMPRDLFVPEYKAPEEQQMLTNIRGGTEVLFREIVLLCLHRAYFARALLEPPFDPLRSVYSRSVLAAYAGSCAIVGRFNALYEREPLILMRFSWFWTNAFSAAVILAAIAIRAPDCPLADTSFAEFNVALEIFRKEQTSARAGGFPTLLHLRERAQDSMNAYKSAHWTRPTTTDPELLMGLGASGSVVENIKTQSSPSSSSSSQLDRNDAMASLGDFQPTLNEYFKSLDNNPQMQPGILGRIPTSDSFLHGVLGLYGNQEYHSRLSPQPPSSFDPASLLGTSGFSYGGSDSTSSQPSPQPPPSMSPIPSSGFDAAFMTSAPTNIHLSQASTATQIGASAEDSHAAFLWDSFFRDFSAPESRK